MTTSASNTVCANRTRRGRTTLCVLLGTGAALAFMGATALADDTHVMVGPDEVDWAPGPASIPAGAEAAVLYGDPGAEELFVLRLRLPADYEIPAHRHPRPEVVTVISGTFHLGIGEQADRETTRALGPGSFFAFEPGHAHYAYTDEETVVQLNSVGPWAIEYVNPEDDPRSGGQVSSTAAD